MRSVVCVTGPQDADLGAVVTQVRQVDTRSDVLVVGSAPNLAAAPGDVARIEIPAQGSPVEPVWLGLRWAVAEDYDQVICLPADLPAAAVPILSEALSGADAVVGSRFMRAGRALWKGPGMARAGNWATQALLRLPVRDTTSSLMGMKRHVLEAVNLADLRAPGPAGMLALKLRVNRLGFTLAEVPIEGLDSRLRVRRDELVDAAGRVLQMFVRGR